MRKIDKAQGSGYNVRAERLEFKLDLLHNQKYTRITFVYVAQVHVEVTHFARLSITFASPHSNPIKRN